MLFSSPNAMLTLFRTKSHEELFRSDCITLDIENFILEILEKKYRFEMIYVLFRKKQVLLQ